ncbi:hypothetical protein O6H91_03G052000 [Diphasiastrum complanatum]|uniref:Uncharacterized protein n=1 Tax=Diphasiastrum complanatum TaxID=34168 RepID=A0ACC2E675_DIPCM|nr:hypothetical protein O6H91_03G052000 [Diphasiastrum complanatum]
MRTSETLLLCELVMLTGIALHHVAHAQTTCQTSNASPSAYDCVNAAAYITSLGSGTRCCQENCRGSLCTTMHTSGSCKVGICGACGQCLPCDVAGTDLSNVVSSCQSNGKVGGFFIDDNNNHLQFIVFS